jgi:hypothetical protein
VVIGNSLCRMVTRPSVIFGDGTKNFLDDDLLADAFRSNREVDVFVLRMARQKFLRPAHPTRLRSPSVRKRPCAAILDTELS